MSFIGEYQDWQYWDEYCAHELRPKYPQLYVYSRWLRFVWSYIPFKINVTICKYRGHNIVMEADIGPDSGIEYWECTRCGFSGSYTYY